ncbi:MAG TPA: hypothetical protein VHU80_03360 [Polyangiaceae bacterium]|nr:hypothetical protein [Polyangiaceae bacterium]
MAEQEDCSPFDGITALARASAREQPTEETQAWGRARLMASAERIQSARRRRSNPSPRARFLPAALAVAATLSVLALSAWRFAQPLTYEVGGNQSSARDYVSASVAAPARVLFSDGTLVMAAPGARLRIEETKRTGARVLVERGSTTAQVRHRQGSSWYFDAGPFEVHVTGTRLTIVWDPELEHIDVTLHEGSVEIETPIGPSRYVVRAGHRFTASVRDGMVKFDDAANATLEKPRRDSEPSTAELPGTASPIGSADTTPERAEPPTTAPRSAPPRGERRQNVAEDGPRETWTELVRRGAFEDVVGLAEGRGVSSCLATCTSADLRALADAARYSGAPALATPALTALRSRFGGTSDGVAAAFLLGRVAEAGGDPAGAERWYTAYRAEAPGGRFASDALAGEMRVAARRGATAEAKALAVEYMNRYPDGPSAAAARKLAGSR